MNFLVKGTLNDRGEQKKFTKEISAETKEKAKDVTYAKIGGNHRIKRFNIKIESVEEVREE